MSNLSIYYYCILFKLCSSSLISLPKHKVSGDIKGFAFVEFSTEDETRTALEVCVRGWVGGWVGACVCVCVCVGVCVGVGVFMCCHLELCY